LFFIFDVETESKSTQVEVAISIVLFVSDDVGSPAASEPNNRIELQHQSSTTKSNTHTHNRNRNPNQELADQHDADLYIHWVGDGEYEGWVFSRDITIFLKESVLAWYKDKGDANGQWPARVHLPAMDSKINHGVASRPMQVIHGFCASKAPSLGGGDC
jgi:hypothetical protein